MGVHIMFNLRNIYNITCNKLLHRAITTHNNKISVGGNGMRSQSFGVEIELTGITRKRASEIIASYFNTQHIYVGGSYKTYTVKDTENRTWKVMSDSSIKPMVKENNQILFANEQYRVEIVTPILQYKDIEILQEIVRAVREGGGFVTDLCGIHIHIDSRNHTPQTLKNLINLIASKEDILYDSLKIKKGRLRYCKKVNKELVAVINKKKPKTIDELADYWYAEYPNADRKNHYNNTRYHGLNLHSLFTNGTVEFRCFNSTLHAGKVKAYIQFCLAVNHQALIQRSASGRKVVTDNPKYSFRCWMLRMGLIGDEFKTCRYHFIKNLKGDSAWRNPDRRI